MVFGIGEGKIELELNTHDAPSGGKISGTLKLELPSPKKAKELRVEIIGERREMRRGKRRTVRIYEFKKPLGGEQEYTSGQYEFELPVPQQAKQGSVPQEGALGTIVGLAKAFGVGAPIQWYVVGVLDIPMSLDINKKVQIAIV